MRGSVAKAMVSSPCEILTYKVRNVEEIVGAGWGILPAPLKGGRICLNVKSVRSLIGHVSVLVQFIVGKMGRSWV